MSFSHIYGHEQKIKILQKTLAQKRTGHAYLFSGLEAIGKKTLALELVKAINCAKSDSLNDSCDECPSCRKIAKGIHPDIFPVQAEGQFIRIDTIRQMQERTRCRPLEAKKRAFIIDDADRMNDPSANALLKMLEEPTSSNILILVTTRPSALPQTILSRCQQMRFNPLSAETVAGFLVSEMKMDEQQAVLLASLSGGSIGNALALNKDNIVDYRRELLGLLAAASKKDAFSLINLASFLGSKKKEIRQGLNIVNSFFRDLLIFKETGKNEMLINQDHYDLIQERAGRLSGEQILQSIEQIEKAGVIIEQNVNKSLTLETMAFKLSYSESQISAAERTEI